MTFWRWNSGSAKMMPLHLSSLRTGGTQTLRRDQSKMITFFLSDGSMIYDWFDNATTTRELFAYLREAGIPMCNDGYFVARMNNTSDREFYQSPTGKRVSVGETPIGDVVKDHYVTLYVRLQAR